MKKIIKSRLLRKIIPIWLLVSIIPGAHWNAPLHSQSICLNEIMYNPEISALYEFIELYNPASLDQDLSGYYFDRGIDYTFADGVKLPGHGYVLLVKDLSKNINHNLDVPKLGPYEGKLANDGEQLSLCDREGNIVESVNYSDIFPWSTGADGYGASLERLEPDLPADDFHNWRSSLIKGGTPGFANSTADTPPKPTIIQCDIKPPNPGATEQVEVILTLDAPGSISRTYLNYEILQQQALSNVTQLEMVKLEEDQECVNFHAKIPPIQSQSLVRFNFDIVLTDETKLKLPHAGERKPFYSYFVYDSEIHSLLPIMWLFPFVSSGLVNIDTTHVGIVIVPAGGAAVQVFDAVERRRSENGHKITFIKGEEYLGNRTLNMIPEMPVSGGTSGSQAPFVEDLAFKFYQLMGVLAPSGYWFRVLDYRQLHPDAPQPDSPMTHHLFIQQPNEAFLKLNNRNPDGNIYKVLWDKAIPEKKTNLDENCEALLELLKIQTIGDSLVRHQKLVELLNIEKVIAYEAASILLSNWDGFHNNMFLYHAISGNNRWEIIPWDLDKTWGFTDANPMYTELPLSYPRTGFSAGVVRPPGFIASPLHSDPYLDNLYRERVAYELDHLFSESNLISLVEANKKLLLDDLTLIEQQIGHTRERHRLHITESYESITKFIKLRHQYLRQQLKLPLITIEQKETDTFGNIFYQNYPNPFNSITTLKFYLEKKAVVRINVYNIQSRAVMTPIHKELLMGSHQITLDFAGFSAGVYFVQLTTIGCSQTKKILFLK